MTDLESGLVRKARESADTLTRFVDEHSERIVECARALKAMFDSGGTLYTLGNGGSACDAHHVAVEFCHPILDKRIALPATALSADAPLMSAIGNDADFSLGFERQVRLLCTRGDAVLGVSTSGKSRNVIRALKAGREMGLLTIGFTGRDGGSLAEVCDHAFVVPSFSVHRIQETHALLVHLLWDTVHVLRGEEDVL